VMERGDGAGGRVKREREREERAPEVGEREGVERGSGVRFIVSSFHTRAPAPPAPHTRHIMSDCPVTEANLVNVNGLPVAVRWLLAVAVVLVSGFFAGMTLGIMGLDKVGLQIVATAGDTEKERRHARELLVLGVGWGDGEGRASGCGAAGLPRVGFDGGGERNCVCPGVATPPCPPPRLPSALARLPPVTIGPSWCSQTGGRRGGGTAGRCSRSKKGGDVGGPSLALPPPLSTPRPLSASRTPSRLLSSPPS